ncbi:MAG: extracellular solute-binding protein, partial [Caldimicrobium sp.]|nr:extracellular solute-binding protein [Caldimicrobium sp.]
MVRRSWLIRFISFTVVWLLIQIYGVSKIQAQELVVYSGRAERLIKPLFDKFTEKTGIKIKAHYAGSVELYNKLLAEGDRSPADLFITVDAATLERARIAGLLEPIKSKEIEENVPSPFRAPDNSWIGLSLRLRVIAYNPQKVNPEEIKTFDDLLKPKFKGRIGIRTGSNIYPQSHTAMMIAERGLKETEKFLRALLANVGDRIYPSDTRIVEAIAKGEIDLGIVNHYYVYIWLRDNPKDKPNLSLIFPPKTAYNVSGIGILKNSKQKDLALKLVEFLASPEAQRLVAELNREYPVNPKIPHHEDMFPRAKL